MHSYRSKLRWSKGYPNENRIEPPFIFDEIHSPANRLWQRNRLLAHPGSHKSGILPAPIQP